MIILSGDKTQAFPIPGVDMAGRKLFIEIRPGDDEKVVGMLCKTTEYAVKTFVDLVSAKDPEETGKVLQYWSQKWAASGIQLTLTKKPNADPLGITEVTE